MHLKIFLTVFYRFAFCFYSDTEPVKKSSSTGVEEMKKITPTSNDISATSPLTSHHAISIKDNLADDVDAAATAMLVLKHGACAFDIKTGILARTWEKTFHEI